MSAGRLFETVYLLLERGRMTADALASALGVSVRTVYRDVDALADAGIPVYTIQGKGGGVALMDGYVLDRASFSPAQQLAILNALREAPDGQDGQALEKLAALFRRTEDQWLRINLTRWGAPKWDEDTYRRLRDAVVSRRTTRLTYASSRGVTGSYTVLPARLIFKGLGWYLQGLDTDRDAYRTFRLSRILSADTDGPIFHRRLDPPEVAFSGDLPPLFRVEANLRFAPHMAWRVYDEFDRSCVTVEEDGSLTVATALPDDARLEGYLLSFGVGMEVLAPAELREKVAAAALAIAGR